MEIVGNRSVVTGRRRKIIVVAIAALGCDALVAVTAYAEWRAFAAAPTNASFVREDDTTYAAAGFCYGVTSVLRYLVLAVLVFSLLRYGTRRTGGRAAAPLGRRRPMLIAAVSFAAIEVLYLAASWTQSDANGTWWLTRLATCAISASASGLVIGILQRGPERQDPPPG